MSSVDVFEFQHQTIMITTIDDLVMSKKKSPERKGTEY